MNFGVFLLDCLICLSDSNLCSTIHRRFIIVFEKYIKVKYPINMMIFFLCPYCFRNLSKNFSDMVFRLDQDEWAGGLSTHLGNLSTLMENSPKRSAQLHTDNSKA